MKKVKYTLLLLFCYLSSSSTISDRKFLLFMRATVYLLFLAAVRRKRGVFQFTSVSPNHHFQFDYTGNLETFFAPNPPPTPDPPGASEGPSPDYDATPPYNPYSYHGMLEQSGRHLCGATIISQYFALTAAHCTHGRASDAMSIRVGSQSLQNGGKIHKVYKVFQHTKFNLKTFDFNYALVSTGVPFSGTTVMKLVNGQRVMPVGTSFTLIGIDPGQDATQIIELETQKIYSEDCHDAYIDNGGITARNFCGNEGSACYGE